MHRRFILILVGSLLLASCNLPGAPSAATPTPDTIATQVSQLLTAQPTATESGAAVPDETAEPPTTEPDITFTPDVEPTESPVPTEPAATAAPTAPASDPKNDLGEPSWQNDLSSADVFYLYENEGTRVTHREGALVLTGLIPNGWHGFSLTFAQRPQNFYLETVFNTRTCAGADLYGMVFRAPDTSSGYFFGVTCDGRYNLHARNFNDGSDRIVIDLTENSAILSGSDQTNRLGIMANGDQIGLYANGVLLQQVVDSTFSSSGHFGPFIAAYPSAGFTVEMDQVSLWNLP